MDSVIQVERVICDFWASASSNSLHLVSGEKEEEAGVHQYGIRESIQHEEGCTFEEATSWVDGQVKALEEMEPQAPEEIFTSMYAAMPPHVVEQMQSLLEEVQP